MGNVITIVISRIANLRSKHAVGESSFRGVLFIRRPMVVRHPHFLILAFGSLLFGSSRPAVAGASRERTNEGDRYREAVIDAIQASDRIVVTEHSDCTDFPREIASRNEAPRYEYGRVELTPPVRAGFLRSVMAMDSTTQSSFATCLFAPHHTIEFYGGGKLQSTMQICFQCADIEWDATRRIASPLGMFSALQPLIKVVGFQEKRDWKALRIEAEKKSLS